MNKRYFGTVIPMITPIDANGEIDITSVQRIIRSFCAAGVSPLLLGTTGEGTSVSRRNGVRLIEAASEAAFGKFTIYAAVSGGKMDELIEDANAYHKAGASVITATLPSYYELNGSQIEEFYRVLAGGISAPFMLYNIKKTTGMSIPIDVVERLSHIDNIVGIKDSENDLVRLEKCLAITRDREDFSYFCGCAANSVAALRLGADGIVPSSGNYAPYLYTQLIAAVQSGNTIEADALQLSSNALGSVYQAGNTLGESLAALKLIMGTKNLCGPYMLPPLTRLSSDKAVLAMEKINSYEKQ